MRWVAPLLAVAGLLVFGVGVGTQVLPLLLMWVPFVALIALLAGAPGTPRRIGAGGLALVCVALTTLGGLFLLPATLALALLPGERAGRRRSRR
jgi:hypothetical protein